MFVLCLFQIIICCYLIGQIDTQIEDIQKFQNIICCYLISLTGVNHQKNVIFQNIICCYLIYYWFGFRYCYL